MSLQDVKAGDNVILRTGGWQHIADIVPVERATATQIIVRGDRYNRNRGRLVGSNYSSRWIEAATPSNLANAKEITLAYQMTRRINAARSALDKFRVTEDTVADVEVLLAKHLPKEG